VVSSDVGNVEGTLVRPLNMDRPIRIIRLIARLNIGGPAIQSITLSSGLPADQYKTLLVTGSITPGEGDMTYHALGKGVEPMIIKELGRNISLFDDIKSFFAIRRIMKHFKPEIVHTHTAKAGTLGRLAVISVRWPFSKLRKIRTVHTFHGHTFHSYFNWLKTFIFIQIEKVLARFTDRIIVVSQQQQKDICQTLKIADIKKVQIIRLGFDLSTFKKIESKPKTAGTTHPNHRSSEPFRVGIVGRLTAVKNHFMLLDAINNLRMAGKIDKFNFFFVGDGELKTELSQKAEELNVMNAIVFSGWRKDMPSVYSELDAVVLTSKNEGTPVAIIEAMASSRPVIATMVGGVPDLIGKVMKKKSDGFLVAEKGLLIPSGNAHALAAALLFLSENLDGLEQMIRRAKEFVLANYSQTRLLNDIKILYDGLI
jgi:glycosyltransferase involved in cell wall biosynthesis